MLITIIVVLVLLGVALWALGQFTPEPIDPTMAKIIRVVLIVVAVLYVLSALGLFHGGLSLR
jgi:hypothetical protein